MSTLFVYVAMPDNEVHGRLGTSEYSYNFVLREFYPLLLEQAQVVRVSAFDERFKAQVAGCKKRGEAHMLLFFSAPHNLPRNLPCPTIPVFAWEFADLPKQPFSDNDFNDWRQALKTTAGAITHSNFALQRVRQAMGADYQAWSIPAPVFNKFTPATTSLTQKRAIQLDTQTLSATGSMYDSHAMFGSEPVLEPLIKTASLMSASVSISFEQMNTVDGYERKIQSGEYQKNQLELQLGGVIYTSILNPADGRKNWQNIVKTFCWALRDQFDATLILKFVHHDPSHGINELKEILGGLPGFKCRVLLLNAFLDDHAYRSLMNVSSYAVNASTGEGQCLPLMEYMSAGVPAVAPAHSAMFDYINDSNAFIVNSSAEPAAIPHEDLFPYRTQQQRVDLDSLADAFRNSYAVAQDNEDVYHAMSVAAQSSLRDHCSDKIVNARLNLAIEQILNSTNDKSE